MFVCGVKVGNWCIKPQRREQVGQSVLSLAKGFKGYFFIDHTLNFVDMICCYFYFLFVDLLGS